MEQLKSNMPLLTLSWGKVEGNGVLFEHTIYTNLIWESIKNGNKVTMRYTDIVV